MNENEPLVGTSQESEQNRSRKTASRIWAVTFVMGASQAMICLGLFTAVTGPTIGFLATNTAASMNQLSYIFSGRSIGVAFGAAAFSVLKAKFDDVKVVKGLSVALLILGVAIMSMPLFRSVISVVMAQMLGGFALGYSETGLTSVYLTTWGATQSRHFIQLNYFMFSFGGFLAPLIAKPFLEMASLQQEAPASCPGQEMISSGLELINQSIAIPLVNYTTPSPVSWVYYIFSGYTFALSVFFIIIATCNVEEKIKTVNIETAECRQEGSLKELWMFFVSVIMFSFFCVSSYIVYEAYIYSVVVCSSLKMSAANASLLNSVFWAGLGISRGLAVITSRYFQPSTMIIVGLVGTTSAMVMMSICGETIAIVMWMGTFLHGGFVAILLPSGISWTSQVTNMTGKYLFLFLLGGDIGTSIMQRIAGAVFEINPFFVIYLVASFCVATSVCFGLMNYFAHRYKVT